MNLDRHDENNVPHSENDTPDEQLTDKLDRLAGGRTVSEEAPDIPLGPRGARAAALQALYEEDLTGHPAMRALRRLHIFSRLSGAQAKRAETLTRHASENRDALDSQIAAVAKEFPVDQLGTVDRNILRIALSELSEDLGGGDRVPAAVVIDEAVELAKLFGSDSSPRFINGVLGALLR